MLKNVFGLLHVRDRKVYCVHILILSPLGFMMAMVCMVCKSITMAFTKLLKSLENNEISTVFNFNKF